MLSYYEIKKMGIQPTIDGPGMAAYATFGPNNAYWVGFDTAETLKSKVSSVLVRPVRHTALFSLQVFLPSERSNAARRCKLRQYACSGRTHLLTCSEGSGVAPSI